jgi:zinc protease
VSVTSGSTLYPAPLSRNTITFRCLPGNVDTLILKTKHILNELKVNPMSFDTELNDVKANLIKTMLIDKQKDSFWSSFIRNTMFNNEFKWNYISDFERIVNSYDSKKIAGFITKYYDQENIIESKLFPKI